MNDNLKDGALKATARRRLIRGAFAAPAALTLCSGSAFAAASNQACVANQVNNPQYPGVNPAATWVRVSVWTHTSGSTPPVTTSLVKGKEVFLLQGTANNRFIKAEEWKALASPDKPFDIGMVKPVKSGDYVALRVNANGDIVGISDGTPGTKVGGTSAVAKSCWTSFSGVAFRN